ncbi:MAG TPA: ABC transporter permease [Lacunisphaera sp.]
MHDLRFALRQLVKSPGFTVVAALTLALGIGANTALFSLMDRLLYRPLPVPEPERLAILAAPYPGGYDFDFNFPLFRDYQRGDSGFEALSATALVPVGIGTSHETERRQALVVSGNYFTMLRLVPALGRFFAPGEGETIDDAAVAVLSHGLWESRFGADPQAIGQIIRINGHAFTVIGITPREFAGTTRGQTPDLYLPITTYGQLTDQRPGGEHPLNSRYFTWHQILGRLRPGVSLEQAGTIIETLNGRIRAATPANTPERLALLPGAQGDVKNVAEVRRPLHLLLAISGLVLLVTCANLANLQLARASGRTREFAVRVALGAGRWQLVRGLLTESILLSVVGGALGVLVAAWLTTLVAGFQPPDQSFELTGNIDFRLLVFTAVVSIGTGVVFGLAPAWQASRPEPVGDLKAGGGATETRGWSRSLRHALVVLQVAVSLVVVVCAGLFSRSLRQLQRIDPGFEPAHVVVASFDLVFGNYNATQVASFYERLLARVRTLPGVEAASLSIHTPLDGFSPGWSIDRIEGYQPKPDEHPWCHVNFASPDYFRTLSVSLLNGRDFNAMDTAASPRVAIVDEAFARTYRAGDLSVGWHIQLPPADGRGPPTPVEVVGIVGSIRGRNLAETPRPIIYCPTTQQPQRALTLAFRTGLDSDATLAALHSAVKSIDSNVPVFHVRTMQRQIDGSITLPRLAAALLDGFGMLTIVLVALGLYGVLAYSVSRRTREFGVRLALGAGHTDIHGLVLGHGFRLVLLGAMLGLGGALAGTRLIRTQLFNVSPFDGLVFTGATLLLIAVAALSCWLPARRATKVDPMTALRTE